MRGIIVDVNRFRQIRQARLLTQRELALRAGVGERTVRNAETGRRVRLEFLNYLAAALGCDLLDLVDDRDELRMALREQRNTVHIVQAMEAFAYQRDLSEIRGLMADNALIRAPGPQAIPFTGEYRGFDGLKRFLDIGTETIAYERPIEVRDIRASGNFVVMSGMDWIRAIPTGKSYSAWWQHVYEFENGRVVRLDDLFDTASALPAFL